MEVDDDMEPSPDNFPLVDLPDSKTLFEVQTWGWDVIDLCAVVAQNQNEPTVTSLINYMIACCKLRIFHWVALLGFV